MSTVRFLTDENIETAIIRAARRMEPALELRTAQEAGLLGTDDSAVLRYANEHSLIVVSHDVNTMISAAESRVAAHSGMPGLFIVRQPTAARAIAESRALIWGASTADEWEGRIVFLPI